MVGNGWGLDRPGNFIAWEVLQLAVKTDYVGVSGNSLWMS